MTLADFHFIRPLWLLTLLPALALFVLLLRNRLGRGNWNEVCDAELLPFILEDRNVQRSRWPLSTAFAASILSIIALAGPTWERLPAPVFRNASALVITLDLSRSMDATDIKPSRLIRTRYKIADILKQRKDGQTALLVYAGDAFTVTPLTEDNETIANQLNALKTDIMPSQGSNTLAGLRLAIGLLQQAGLQQGEILLISDGIEGDAVRQAETLIGNYRLSVLGVGTPEGAPVKSAEGGFLKDHQGNIVVPKLNTETLATLARFGKGTYRTITNDDNDIETLLAAMERPTVQSDDEKNLYLEQWDEKGPWLLWLVLPLAALSFRKGLLIFTLIILLPYPKDSYALDWRDLWQTHDQQAEQAFKRQQFAEAAGKFESPEWKAAAQFKAGNYQQAAETLQNIDTAEGHYNRGNALAKAGQLQQALQAYQRSLQLDPDHEDAQYNKELVEKALDQQQQKNESQQGEDSQQSDQDQQNSEGESTQDAGEQQEQSSAENTDSAPQNERQSDQSEAAAETNEQQSEAQNQQPQSQTDFEQHSLQQTEIDESTQASEQWLKRIPDDPSGLLKRKFRYQYGQRSRKQPQRDQRW